MDCEPPGTRLMREFTLKERPLPKWNRRDSRIFRRSHRSLAGQAILAVYIEVRRHPQLRRSAGKDCLPAGRFSWDAARRDSCAAMGKG